MVARSTPRHAALALLGAALLGAAVLGPLGVALAEGPVGSAPAAAASALASAGAGEPAPTDARLQKAAEYLDGWARAKGGRAVVHVVELATDATLAQVDAARPENPASNQKLLTAAVALARLGPDFRFTTALHGVVEGNTVKRLVLRGNGDPGLALEHLVALAGELRALGVTRVGALEVDQSRFDTRWVPPAFEQQPDEWAAFRAPVAAVSLERNAVALVVEPGREGEPTRAWFDPPGFVEARGAIRTGAAGTGVKVELTLTPATGAAAGTLNATLGGTLAQGLPRQRFAKRVDDPGLFAGRVLAQVLAAQGVTVAGAVALGGADERATLAVHRSAPLGELLGQLGKHSDNFHAEVLLKALGADRTGKAGTSADGAAVLVEWLKQRGAFEAGVRVQNGSGLFDANRLTARSLTRVLSIAFHDPALHAEYLAHLAIGGVDGTLTGRFRAWRERRAIRAKTGTLAKVVALSGYVLGPRGRSPAAFAVLVTGVSDHEGARAETDRLVNAIAARVWGDAG